MTIIRAAVVQDAPQAFDQQRTLAKVAERAAQAATQGAQLVVFPESFLFGYPKGLDFGARVGMRLPEGRIEFQRYFENSVEVPGPIAAALGEIASRNALFLVMGVTERDGGTLYCTVLFFSPSGELLGKHRKLMPTAMERLVWGFGDGSTLPVFDTAIGRIGAVICWENYMPLLRTAMYAQGIQIYCVPTVDDRETWLPTIRHIAQEGRCFVLSSNQFARRSDYPEAYPAIQGNDPETVMIRGGSCIVSPLGQVLAGPLFNEAGLLVADLDLGEIARGKYDLDVVGHYARPDIFQLHVNTHPMPPVTFEGGKLSAE